MITDRDLGRLEEAARQIEHSLDQFTSKFECMHNKHRKSIEDSEWDPITADIDVLRHRIMSIRHEITALRSLSHRPTERRT